MVPFLMLMKLQIWSKSMYTRNPLSGVQYSELQATVSPFHNTKSHGVDLFIKTLDFVYEKIS